MEYGYRERPPDYDYDDDYDDHQQLSNRMPLRRASTSKMVSTMQSSWSPSHAYDDHPASLRDDRNVCDHMNNWLPPDRPPVDYGRGCSRGRHAPSAAAPPSYNRDPKEDSREFETDDSGLFVKSDRRVDFVHHDSPVGPAVSVYPRGYDRGDGMDNPSPAFEDVYEEPTESSYEEEEYRSCPRTVFHSDFRGRAEFKSRDSSYSSKTHEAPTGPKMVEISPGLRVRLRGAAETRDCVARDFFTPSLCFACNLEMFCIQDACFVLCPSCRVVNPVSEIDSNFSTGGLGLGFTFEELSSIKRDLAQQSSRSRFASAHF
jgi:hypothetical protein